MELIFVGEKYKSVKKILVNMLQKGKFKFCEKDNKTGHSNVVSIINIYNKAEMSRENRKIIIVNMPYFNASDMDIQLNSGENDYVIINNEAELNISDLYKPYPIILTYGFNHKCSITASSVQEDALNTEMQICIQRKFNNIFGQEMLPGEFTIHVSDEVDLEIFISLVSLFMVLGYDMNDFL